MKTFKEFISEGKFDVPVTPLEHDAIAQHMADKGFNVTKVHRSKVDGGKLIHVHVNNLDAEDKPVDEKDFLDAETHLKKLGDDHVLHVPQKIKTKVGGTWDEANPDIKRAGSSVKWTGD